MGRIRLVGQVTKEELMNGNFLKCVHTLSPVLGHWLTRALRLTPPACLFSLLEPNGSF